MWALIDGSWNSSSAAPIAVFDSVSLNSTSSLVKFYMASGSSLLQCDCRRRRRPAGDLRHDRHSDGANAYTGTTLINAGATLKAGSASAFGAGGALVVYGTAELAGFSLSVGALGGPGILDNNAGTATLTMTFSGPSATFSGVIKTRPATR